MSDCYKYVKLGLQGEASTRGYQFVKTTIWRQDDGTLEYPPGSFDLMKHGAVEMFCTALGSSSSPEDWRNFDVQIESYDKDGDIISLHTEGDFHLLHSYMPHDRFIKIHATVTAPQLSPTVDTVLDSSASVATQTLEKDLTKSEDKDDQKIVNAIADLFSIAALSMKAGVTAAKHEIDVVKKTSENNIKGVRKLSKDSLKVAKKLSKESFKQVRNVLKNGTDCAAGSPLTHKSSPAESSPPHDNTHLPTAETPIVPNKIDVKPTPEPPFIHGRHTCDQCLTTPVIGKRFHALNLPDYDLCESCYGNYKGTEIVFEDVRLERDDPYQERWNRKRAMHESSSMKRLVSVHHHRSRCSHQRHMCGRSVLPTELERSAGAESISHPGTGNSPNITPIPDAASDDLALEEAIRRSLVDVVGTENIEKEEIIPTLDGVVAVALKVCDNGIVNDSDTSLSSGDEVQKIDVTEEAEIVLNASGSGEFIALEKETSFANEAIGSGDVAAFVGETLDRMSEAIEELNNEMAVKGDLVFANVCPNGNNEDDTYASDDEVSGSKIVDGEDDEISTGSWSVVVEKERGVDVTDEGFGRAAEAIGSALFQSDMMRSSEDASAAMSSMTKFSSVASVPTFAPSIATTEQDIPQMQLDRWAVQLEQLRELGFTNDAVCVDALESLTAANIGVDSDEEVSVQQVIEKLMDY